MPDVVSIDRARSPPSSTEWRYFPHIEIELCFRYPFSVYVCYGLALERDNFKFAGSRTGRRKYHQPSIVVRSHIALDLTFESCIRFTCNLMKCACDVLVVSLLYLAVSLNASREVTLVKQLQVKLVETRQRRTRRSARYAHPDTNDTGFQVL